MLKINKLVEIHAEAFRDSSVDGIRVDLKGLKASDWLGALLTELRRALAATCEHQDLVRRSDGQLASQGLTRKDIPNRIYRRYYAD